MQISDTLFLIPARGGSKGLPRKNILPLAGKPMICYSIDAARGVTSDENICVSTDNDEIRLLVENYGLKVPFLRPNELASDTSGSRELILHAINYYKYNFGISFVKVCLLQPTSPLRTFQHIIEAFNHWNDNLDMVVSVKESKINPYYNLFEEDKSGFLKKSFEGHYTRRQDAPKFWEYNGAIYIINIDSIKLKTFDEFTKKIKYEMNSIHSIDVDNENDFRMAEYFLKDRLE